MVKEMVRWEQGEGFWKINVWKTYKVENIRVKTSIYQLKNEGDGHIERLELIKLQVRIKSCFRRKRGNRKMKKWKTEVR